LIAHEVLTNFTMLLFPVTRVLALLHTVSTFGPVVNETETLVHTPAEDWYFTTLPSVTTSVSLKYIPSSSTPGEGLLVSAERFVKRDTPI